MALPLSSSSTPSLSFTATPSKSLSCTLSPPNSTRFLTRRRFLSLKAMLTTVDSPSAADAGSGSPKVLLEVKNLRAVIAESRQEILRGVNLTINEDEVHAIMGKNGSGKSTFSKMEPGPISTNVLYQQSHHRSRKIESGEDPGVVTLIDHARSHQDWPLVDARVRVLVGRAGFLACSQLSWIRLDWSLITALLERWRPETETFHLRVGEMTVTLQDVAVLLGLRIDGHPVTGTDDRIWSDVCRTGLGRVPPLTGGCIRLRWLRETFQQVPANAGANRVRWHARAYILHMIGTLLFPDSNKGTVHARWLPLLQDFDVCGTLSWGSAVLAYLYKELAKVSLMETKELHACITLLQAWSWEHIGVGRPALLQTRELNGQIPLACRWNVDRSYAKMPNREIRLYRNELDVMEPTQENGSIIKTGDISLARLLEKEGYKGLSEQ